MKEEIWEMSTPFVFVVEFLEIQKKHYQTYVPQKIQDLSWVQIPACHLAHYCSQQCLNLW